MIAGVVSVYDQIKKELMALKIDTSSLAASLKRVASHAALQEAIRRHAETDAKLALVAKALVSLEERLESVVVEQHQAAAAYRVHLQVCHTCDPAVFEARLGQCMPSV